MARETLAAQAREQNPPKRRNSRMNLNSSWESWPVQSRSSFTKASLTFLKRDRNLSAMNCGTRSESGPSC